MASQKNTTYNFFTAEPEHGLKFLTALQRNAYTSLTFS